MKRLLPLLLFTVVLFFTVACGKEAPVATEGEEIPVQTEEKVTAGTENEETESLPATSESVTTTTAPTTTTKAPTTTTKAPTATTTKVPVTTTKKAEDSYSYTPTLNYTRLPEKAGELYNSPAGGITGNENLYKKMVNAYLNYETRVPIAVDESPFAVLNMLRFHFPLFFADTKIEVDFASTLEYANITYTTTRAEHFRLIESFEKRVKSLLAAPYGSTDAEKALTVYIRYCESLDYDDALAAIPLAWDYLYYGDNPRYDEGYRALMEGKGVCSGFAIGYSFLLSQMGLDSYCVFAGGTRDAHAWTAMKLNGKWYFADPTADAEWPGMTNPIFRFGGNVTERLLAGYPKAGFRYSNCIGSSDFLSVTDSRFQQLYDRQAYAPVIDYENHSVKFKSPNTFTYTLSLA